MSTSHDMDSSFPIFEPKPVVPQEALPGNLPDSQSAPHNEQSLEQPAIENVVHSGNLPVEHGRERPVREFDQTTLLDAVQGGKVRDTIPGSGHSDVITTPARNFAPNVPAPQLAPQKERWSGKKKAIAFGAAGLAFLGGGTVAGLALSGKDSEAAPVPAVTSTPNTQPNTQANQTSSVDLNTNSAVIVAPIPKVETTPPVTTASSPSEQQSTTSQTTETAPTAFALEPAANGAEYPKEQQKYVINTVQMEQDPAVYLSNYGESIGAKENPVSDAEFAQFETWLEKAGLYNVQIGEFVNEKQGGNLTALGNALLANPNLNQVDKKAVVKYFASLLLFNNLDETIASDKMIPIIEEQVTKIPKGSIMDVEIVTFGPGSMAVQISGKDTQSGVATYQPKLDFLASGPIGYSNNGAHGFRWVFEASK